MDVALQKRRAIEQAREERTRREHEVLEGFDWRHRIVIRGLAAGLTNREVAKQAGYSEQWICKLAKDEMVGAAISEIQAIRDEPLASNTDYLRAIVRIRNEHGPTVYEDLLLDKDTPPVVKRQLLADLHDATAITAKALSQGQVDPDVARDARKVLGDIADIANAVRRRTMPLVNDRDRFAQATPVDDAEEPNGDA